jgi:hypothetical protein
MMDNKTKRYVVDRGHIPENCPTHRHSPAFWESLGRAVATFGFLEEVLGKAVFALTATRPYSDKGLEEAFENWKPIIRQCLNGQLGGLIDTYQKALKDHPDSTLSNPEDLADDLREASRIRNVLCHGSWNEAPNDEGKSVPFFFDKKLLKFDTPVDVNFLDQTQKHTVSLIYDVMDSIKNMGLQFPGTSGPGRPIVQKKKT